METGNERAGMPVRRSRGRDRESREETLARAVVEVEPTVITTAACHFISIRWKVTCRYQLLYHAVIRKLIDRGNPVGKIALIFLV